MNKTAPQGRRSRASCGHGYCGAGVEQAGLMARIPVGSEVVSLCPGKVKQPNHHSLQRVPGRLMPAAVVNTSQGCMSPSELPEALNLAKK